MQSYIELKNIKKYYHMGEVEIKIIQGKGIDLSSLDIMWGMV